MSRIYFNIFMLFMVSSRIEASFGAYWHKFATAADGTCAAHNVKLLSLLNLLCNTTQTTSVQMRDACYGCFFRAGSIINGVTQLSSLNDCAQLYIADSQYATCAANLQATIDGNRPTSDTGFGFCYTGYCEFVRCIRRINAQQLILACYADSLGTFDLEADNDRIFFYTNITACILARTRCSLYNPISGELQNNVITPSVASVANKVTAVAAAASHGWIGGALLTPQPLYFNSLQISEMGDIRVITFPTASTSVTDLFCSRAPNLQQAGFSTFTC